MKSIRWICCVPALSLTHVLDLITLLVTNSITVMWIDFHE
ncbi:hypothetical protein M758_UG131700 [Ceratodon purpureus]|nr:hypothetical protein M758_UG131700 [Ceratodon purpureus]